MATNTVNQRSAEEIAEAGEVKPFVFHREEVERISLPGRAVMAFVGDAADISGGAQEILELLMWDDRRRNDVKESDTPELEQQPVLSPYTRDALMRFTSTSLKMLAGKCDEMRVWAYEHHTPEGRLDNYEQALFSLKSHRQKVPSTATD